MHTLLNASIIHLHRDFFALHPASTQQCLVAAHQITAAIDELDGNDYDFLNPILSVRFASCSSLEGRADPLCLAQSAWKCAAHVYLKALAMQHGQVLSDSSVVEDWRRRLNTLHNAMEMLGRLFPVSGMPFPALLSFCRAHVASALFF